MGFRKKNNNINKNNTYVTNINKIWLSEKKKKF